VYDLLSKKAFSIQGGARLAKSIVIAMSLVVLLAGTCAAQGSGFGIGIILGEPTGLSCKAWTTEATAFDVAAAWSFTDDGAFHIHADYLYHRFDLFDLESGSLPLYFGIGGRIKFLDDTRASLRLPVGIDYFFGGAPLDAFFEVVPMLDLAPETEFDISAGIGLRYFF
jgi:hypothetical protein